MTDTPKLLVLTPSLGRVSIGYRDTFARLTLECSRKGIALDVADATDPGQLVHARNVLYGYAIRSSATHALWWDADVSFVDVHASVFDLLDRPEAMIARPYPMRAVDWGAVGEFVTDACDPSRWTEKTFAAMRRAAQRWTAQVEFESGRPVWSEDRKLVRIVSCGFGWVLMKLGEMREFSEGYAGGIESHPKDWQGRSSPLLFDFVHPEGMTHGEDTSFCHRWRLSGRYIWAAPDLRIQNGDHGGTFAEYLCDHFPMPR